MRSLRSLQVPKTFATCADSRGNASAPGLRQVAAGPGLHPAARAMIFGLQP
jgi:hypothetical protein